MSLSKFYHEGFKKLFSIYYSEDLAIRSPRFMTIPEPEPTVLVRPLAKYGTYIGVTDIGNIPWYWDPSLIQNPLIAILGMPGSGKSETIKTLIINFKRKVPNLPIIVVDPEGEYHTVVEQLGEGVVLNIGVEHFVNILDRPSLDFNYYLWVSKAVIPGILKALRVTERQAPLMIRVLEKAIIDVYEKIYGFKPVDPSTWRKEDPTLLDVVRQLENNVKPYLEGKVKKQPPLFRTTMSLLERLRRWVSSQGTDFFAHRSTVRLSELIKQPLVVFNIKELPEDAKDMFTYYIFSYFYALMEMTPPLPRFGLRLLLVFDEGWILLKRERGQESPLAPLFRRARKYGFASIIATHHFRDVSSDILPLVGTVIILRIRDADGVKKLKETLKLPDRIANMIPSLPTGKAVVSIAWKKTDFQNSDTPFVVRVESAVKKMVPVIVHMPKGPHEVIRALKTQFAKSE